MAKQPNRTGGHLWGPRRVEAAVSIKQLAAASGIAQGTISMMEHGRFIPTADEQATIEAALEQLIAAGQAAPA
jgi:transcriptional regulator with XRE-family HTH domain